jgi:hypothetical protein
VNAAVALMRTPDPTLDVHGMLLQYGHGPSLSSSIIKSGK